MSSEARMVQFSLRLDPADKATLTEAAELCDTDASSIARELLELVAERVRAGGSARDVLNELRVLWRERRLESLEQQLADANKRLDRFQAPESFEATCREISRIAAKLAEG